MCLILCKWKEVRSIVLTWTNVTCVSLNQHDLCSLWFLCLPLLSSVLGCSDCLLKVFGQRWARYSLYLQECTVKRCKVSQCRWKLLIFFLACAGMLVCNGDMTALTTCSLILTAKSGALLTKSAVDLAQATLPWCRFGRVARMALCPMRFVFGQGQKG